MKGLLLKEWETVKQTDKWTLLLSAIFFLVGGTIPVGSFALFSVMYSGIMVSSVVTNHIFYDETSGWKDRLRTLPVKPEADAAAKYILGLLLSLASVVGVLIMGAASVISWGGMPWEKFLLYAFAAPSVALFMNFVSLPFWYRFGAAKGKYFSIFSAALAAGLIITFEVGGIADRTGAARFFPVLLPVFLLLYVLSWRLSRRIVRKQAGV